MSEGGFKLKFGWLEKLKKIKHIEIYILIVFACVLGLIFFSSKKQEATTTNDATITGYVKNLENRLESILSNIEGISDVRVMISLDTSEITIDGDKLKTSSFPNIKGIIVTAKGVGDTKSKMKVLQAIETAFDINTHNIQIFSSN